jgi:hypothetical protein
MKFVDGISVGLGISDFLSGNDPQAAKVIIQDMLEELKALQSS